MKTLNLKKMKTHSYLVYLAAMIIFPLFFASCEAPPNWDDPKDSVPPGAVSNPIVTPLNGGAIIHYTMPSDQDLLGVKAIYSYREGGERLTAYASVHTDSIVLVGFPDTNERNVTLIAFDESGNDSPPVNVTIKPDTPPVDLVRHSLEVRETYSGVFVKWDNPTKTEIGISLFAEDELGIVDLVYTHFTNEAGQHSFRGFRNEERKFIVTVKDRWNNESEPYETRLTPLFEEDIVARDASGRATWIRYGYINGASNEATLWRGDYRGQYSSLAFFNMFEPRNGPMDYFHPGLWADFDLDWYTGIAAHDGVEPKPMHLTIDMTREALISRVKIFTRNDGTSLNPNDPYHISLFATSEMPKQPSDFEDRMESLAYWTTWEQVDGTGAWMDDWTHIGEFFIIPPSGAKSTTEWTAADREWARAGIDFDIFEEHNTTPFRYLRIVAHESLEKSQLVHFVRWDFFGIVVK